MKNFDRSLATVAAITAFGVGMQGSSLSVADQASVSPVPGVLPTMLDAQPALTAHQASVLSSAEAFKQCADALTQPRNFQQRLKIRIAGQEGTVVLSDEEMGLQDGSQPASDIAHCSGRTAIRTVVSLREGSHTSTVATVKLTVAPGAFEQAKGSEAQATGTFSEAQFCKLPGNSTRSGALVKTNTWTYSESGRSQAKETPITTVRRIPCKHILPGPPVPPVEPSGTVTVG